MSSRSGSTRDYETSGQSRHHSASPPVPEPTDTETEGLIFYHMDLYGSKERFDIFPEEPSGRGDRSLGDARRESALSSEKVQCPQEVGYDLEKEVAELAKMYGLDEDREKELELLGGHLEKVESRWPPARTEKAGSQDSIYNISKSSSPVKDSSQSTKQQGLPDEASQGENQSKARADDEAESSIWSRGGLSSGGVSDEWNSQAVSEEEEEEAEAADVFCSTCKIPIRAFDKLFGDHKDHEVAQLPSAVESEKEEIHKNMCKLEEQIAQMENVASHLEEIFITVEENFGRQEQNFEVHYNDAVQVLAQKYEEQLEALGEEKRQKLEALYEQLVSCGKHLDTCKELTDETQELFLENDKAEFMKAAVTMVDRLEEFLKQEVDLELSTLPDFEERVIDVSEVEQLMNSINAIPAPCAPVINPQAPNAATGTSLRVCWGLFSDDTVECYQLCYQPVSNERHSDGQAEHTLKVKETYCTITDLLPNTQYEFWVSALNASGISPPSERAVYVTAPSPPTIKKKKIRSCETAALVCWESRDINPVDSYTVELSKLTDEENDDIITESIVGIPNCEVLIHLQPTQKYHICVRAQNLGGSSERSEPVLIHTTGTCFYLNEDTAHPLLAILDDGFTISCDELENPECDLPVYDNSFTRCIAILGSLIPFPGKHYWEVEVEEDTEYRIGVAFENTPRHGHLGANNSSWCMRHIITPSRHKYEFLHSGMTPDIRITVPPRRIGILLDYENCRLSFFNADIAQHLHTFNSHFQHYVHPCFALETPGMPLPLHNSFMFKKHFLKCFINDSSTKTSRNTQRKRRHRCCHRPTKIYDDGAKPSHKTEYVENYPGYGNVCPPESCKPKPELQEDKARMDGTTTFKSDYLPYEIVPRPFRPQEEYRPKSGKIDLGTIYQRDYNPHKVGPVTLARPRERKHTSDAKVDTVPTYRDHYRLWKSQRTESCKVERDYEPPSERFGNPSTFQDDYIPKQPNPPPSCKPCESKLPEGPFDGNTIHRTAYVVHELGPLFVRPREEYKPSDQPFEDLTTHQRDFKGMPGEQAKSCKPESRKHGSDDPFKGTTEFQDRYQPYVVTAPEFHKPREYVPPTDKMDLKSSNRLDYIKHKVVPRVPVKPAPGRKNTGPFQGKTTTKEDYQAWKVCPQGPIKKEEEIQKPTGKFASLTTFRCHYIPHQANPPQSFKPVQVVPPGVPFKDETLYRTEYTPKKPEVCPGLNPDAAGYVYVSTDSQGHRFYRRESPERSSSDCSPVPEEVPAVS